MDDLFDLMIDYESPSFISDRVKELLYAKSAEKVEAQRPNVSAGLFGEEEPEIEAETEVTDTPPEEEE